MCPSSSGPPRSPIVIRPFSQDFEKAAFSCGVKRIDRYFQEGAQIERANLARLFVGVEKPHQDIPIGYYALHAMHIEVQDVPNTLAASFRRDAILGAIYVAMLGVDSRYQRRGFGSLLFANALRRSKNAAQTLGTWAVVLDALDESVIPFYGNFGFQPLQHGTTRLFLPIASIP